MDAVKQHVISKICGKATPPLVGFEQEHNELVELMSRTVETHQGSSLVVMGPRSSGKSLLVEHALRELESRHSGEYIVVRLSGFAQTDDKMAIREICRQLDLKLAEELQLSEHDFELLERKSMSETLQGFLRIFQEHDTETNSVSVIFVLEELDRFAQHMRQSLLYTLFDLPHNSNSGVSVIGLTSHINLREMLEKRVRSRFSHRLIVLNRPKTLDAFWDICRATLLVSDERLMETHSRECVVWNKHLEALYQNHTAQSNALYSLVESVFYTTKDPRQVNYGCLYEFSKAGNTEENGDLPFSEFDESMAAVQNPSDASAILAGLTELQLALLLSAARAQIKLESDALNFNLVYEEYKTAARAQQVKRQIALTATTTPSTGQPSGYRIWSRNAALSAWEQLEHVDLVVAVNTVTSKKGGSGTITEDLKMVKVDVDLRELAKVIGKDHPLYSWVGI